MCLPSEIHFDAEYKIKIGLSVFHWPFLVKLKGSGDGCHLFINGFATDLVPVSFSMLKAYSEKLVNSRPNLCVCFQYCDFTLCMIHHHCCRVSVTHQAKAGSSDTFLYTVYSDT